MAGWVGGVGVLVRAWAGGQVRRWMGSWMSGWVGDGWGGWMDRRNLYTEQTSSTATFTPCHLHPRPHSFQSDLVITETLLDSIFAIDHRALQSPTNLSEAVVHLASKSGVLKGDAGVLDLGGPPPRVQASFTPCRPPPMPPAPLLRPAPRPPVPHRPE